MIDDLIRKQHEMVAELKEKVLASIIPQNINDKPDFTYQMDVKKYIKDNQLHFRRYQSNPLREELFLGDVLIGVFELTMRDLVITYKFTPSNSEE